MRLKIEAIRFLSSSSANETVNSKLSALARLRRKLAAQTQSYLLVAPLAIVSRMLLSVSDSISVRLKYVSTYLTGIFFKYESIAS